LQGDDAPVSTRTTSPRSVRSCSVPPRGRTPSHRPAGAYDEAFATKQPDAELLLEGDADADAFAATRKESFCAMSSPPISAR
jgi:hypothetical protein